MCTGTHLFNMGKNRSYLTLHTIVDLVVKIVRTGAHRQTACVVGSCVQLVEPCVRLVEPCVRGRVVGFSISTGSAYYPSHATGRRRGAADYYRRCASGAHTAYAGRGERTRGPRLRY